MYEGRCVLGPLERAVDKEPDLLDEMLCQRGYEGQPLDYLAF